MNQALHLLYKKKEEYEYNIYRLRYIDNSPLRLSETVKAKIEYYEQQLEDIKEIIEEVEIL